MTPGVIAILAVGISLAGLLLAVRADLRTIRADLHGLAERVARIEGALWGGQPARLPLASAPPE